MIIFLRNHSYSGRYMRLYSSTMKSWQTQGIVGVEPRFPELFFYYSNPVFFPKRGRRSSFLRKQKHENIICDCIQISKPEENQLVLLICEVRMMNLCGVMGIIIHVQFVFQKLLSSLPKEYHIDLVSTFYLLQNTKALLAGPIEYRPFSIKWIPLFAEHSVNSVRNSHFIRNILGKSKNFIFYVFKIIHWNP